MPAYIKIRIPSDQDNQFDRPDRRHEIALRAHIFIDTPGLGKQRNAAVQQNGHQAGADQMIHPLQKVFHTGMIGLQPVQHNIGARQPTDFEGVGNLEKNAGHNGQCHDFRHPANRVVEQGAPADIQVDDHQKYENPGGADTVHDR